MKEEASSATSQLSARVRELCDAKQAAEENATDLEAKLEEAVTSNNQMTDQVASLQEINN
eukprot:CAMPEP_0172551034 /NCGR_PEP_ID=MMETSP1067-20121228/35287_1 /TAXON_ID=265564 ORGANISM="Thalassiosira punctigera, Strain Tpunct2005C2" /NCGR_SAMPLE_ID=MMETSP1067 /ASSEMBLY_ACC=CAM_ASM_000444 /LENGTH=59 /DNA_ID=CAMNT_0013338751 /DNA_START=39 /DNA_END=215 /DNA_ORIENTATION=-